MNPLVGTCVPSSNTTIPIVSDAVHFSRPACRAFCGGTASPAASRTLCSPVLPRWILLGLLSAVQGRTSASSSEFDYQSVRHCSKTFGANSLLQRDGKTNRIFSYISIKSWSIVILTSFLCTEGSIELSRKRHCKLEKTAFSNT